MERGDGSWSGVSELGRWLGKYNLKGREKEALIWSVLSGSMQERWMTEAGVGRWKT